MQNIQISINRKHQVLSRLDVGRSTLQNRINAGIFPPAISLGGRTLGWLEHEVDATITAMICNKSVEELQSFVSDIVASRKLIASKEPLLADVLSSEEE
jgi:prophage regulatory protein